MFACQVGVVLCLTTTAASRMTLGEPDGRETANTVAHLFCLSADFILSSSRGGRAGVVMCVMRSGVDVCWRPDYRMTMADG